MQDKLRELERKHCIDWREYEIGELFTKRTMKGFPKKAENLEENNKGFHIFGQNIKYQYPQRVLIDEKYLHNVDENKPILAYTSSTGELGIITESFYRSGDNGAFQGLFFKYPDYNKNHILYLLGALSRIFNEFGYSTGMADILRVKVQLPTKNNEIAFNYIEEFIYTLEAERLGTLEAYLFATDLKNTELTLEERSALDILEADSVSWKVFNLKGLFGSATRGKRLKSADRIVGNLPFVTAGETNMGISDFIGNKVQVFSENTVTIDMFGSAKYRNYKYGADDHVAVIHTEKLDEFSALFTASSIHKSAHAGQFDYSRNFYATDADNLIISLPVKEDGNIDYDFMANLMSAIQKHVIKDVVKYLDNRIEATNQIIKED
ncbi:restriction endonuclease subunit S [Lactococcus lactis]|uniref:restriction endonuclease subunit S n=1 Tax=Lactococcus lactis TaxID=1358 RepID=UPI00223B849A|nr:restriction endonuclease subunit S [Lactococcus lactis]MCT1226867.1 restriction endonuclease subunit S [Lactococcus lactis]